MLAALRRIVQNVNRSPSFDVALSLLVSEVRTVLGVEVSSIYLRDPARERFILVANEGLKADAVRHTSLKLDEGLVGLVGRRAEPLNLENAATHPRFHYVDGLGEDPFSAFLGVPIIHHRVVLGVLVVQQRDARRFDESEEAFLVTLSAQLAGVVAHALATGEIVQLLDADAQLSDTKYLGVPGAPGVAVGTAVLVQGGALLDTVPDRTAESVEGELALFDAAIQGARDEIQRVSAKLTGSLPPEERALFDAYAHMLDDEALAGDIRERIQDGSWAQGALRQVILEHVERFEQMEDSYLRERGADVRELGQRVLHYLQNQQEQERVYPNDAVLVGDEVTPASLADVPPEKLRAVVSLKGSSNSHLAILARALNVPTVMGATEVPLYLLEGQTVVVDGYYGEVYANPSDELLRGFKALLEEEQEFAQELEELREVPSTTKDGHRVRLWVNIGLTGDISRSLDRGAEGIGLFRTEVPFMTQDRFPTEEEQRLIYREHMEAFEPRPVTMRTLDIGGDKALTYFPIHEENPFLGWRGIRVTLDHPEIFLVQVRAMLRANEGLECVLRIMLPMVSSLTEVEEATELVHQALREVREEGAAVKTPEVGVMIEVPSAVYQARHIARRVDFLAVGSNDLTQYMLAVDRNNPRVAELYQDLHPAVIQALREVSKAGHAERKPVGICGELAGTPMGAVLLLAMGYDVLSMNAANLPKVKWVIRNIRRSSARRMLARVLRMDSPQEIHAFMQEQLMGAGLGRVLPHHAH